MTREEAIEVIEQDIPCEHDRDLIEALEMAISALKDLKEPTWQKKLEKEYLFESIKEDMTNLQVENERLLKEVEALKGLDLPDNATNNDALNYMLHQTFPRVIFIHFHNEANLTEGIVMSKEWLSKPYEKGNIDQKK